MQVLVFCFSSLVIGKRNVIISISCQRDTPDKRALDLNIASTKLARGHV